MTEAGTPATSTWKVAAIVLAGALIASLVALGFALGSDDAAPQTAPAADVSQQSPEEALALAVAVDGAQAAARKAVVHMTTYSAATLGTDFSWADDAGTAKFRSYYVEVSAPIKQVVAELKTTAVGSVVDSAARAEDVDHVTVLLFVDQVITGQQKDDRQLDQPRVTMKMVREDGTWLVDEVGISNLTTS